MSEYREKKLTREQNRIIDEHQEALPQEPVNIKKLAKAFGCEVEETRFPPQISGSIEKRGPDSYTIRVNEAEGLERRRFTIAHELAHCLLHKEQLGEGIRENIMFRSNLSNSYEVEANKLAAEILMPAQVIDSLIEGGNRTFSGLAEAFGVSRSALLVRLGIPEHPAYYKEA